MNGNLGRNARAIVFAIAAVMAQNASAYVTWGEMRGWQRAWLIIACALIIYAIALTYRGEQ